MRSKKHIFNQLNLFFLFTNRCSQLKSKAKEREKRRKNNRRIETSFIELEMLANCQRKVREREKEKRQKKNQ